MGQAPKGTSYNTTGEGHPLIAGAGDFGEVSPQPKKYTTEPTRLSRVDDIILCIRATIGDRNWSDSIYCLGRGVAGLRANPDQLDQKYLWHWLGSTTPQLRSKGRGATFLQVNRADISSMQIPLPPLPKQRRIAAILDQADALRAKRRQAIAKLDALLQSVFLEMFGDPVTNPKGWSTTLVGDAFSAFVGGKNVACPDSGSSPFRILKVSAVTKKVFLPDESKLAPDDFAPDAEHIVQPGDLLFSRANTAALVAATAYVWETPPNLVLPDKIWRMVLRDESQMSPLFAWGLFKNTEFRNEISKRSSGTSGSMKNISKAKLAQMKMPLPPFNLQMQFAEFSQRLYQQQRCVENQQTQLDNLQATITHSAFAH